MFCPKCGSDVGQSKFCQECGSSIQAPTTNYDNVEKFTLFSAYKSMFKKYAKFSGRSRRSEYWLAGLTNFIIVIALYLIAFIPLIISTANHGEPSDLSFAFIGLGGLLIFAYFIAVFVPSLALSVRRLHDTGKSGWFLLLNLIPYVGGLIIFIFNVLDSQPGENQYGPNPKGM